MPTNQQVPPERAGAAASGPHWIQRGGFSVFFDVVTDDEDGGVDSRRTRVYHEETGREAVLAAPDDWARWILESLGAESRPDRDSRPGSRRPDTGVHHLTVEIVEVRLVSREDGGGGDTLVRIESVLRIDGMAALERALGAAAVGRGLSGRP